MKLFGGHVTTASGTHFDYFGDTLQLLRGHVTTALGTHFDYFGDTLRLLRGHFTTASGHDVKTFRYYSTYPHTTLSGNTTLVQYSFGKTVFMYSFGSIILVQFSLQSIVLVQFSFQSTQCNVCCSRTWTYV